MNLISCHSEGAVVATEESLIIEVEILLRKEQVFRQAQ